MQVECGGCDHNFSVPDSLKGGMTNCPNCRALVELGGASDGGVFWAVVGLALAGWLGLSLLVGLGEPVAGVLMAAFGLVVAGCIALAS